MVLPCRILFTFQCSCFSSFMVSWWQTLFLISGSSYRSVSTLILSLFSVIKKIPQTCKISVNTISPQFDREGLWGVYLFVCVGLASGADSLLPDTEGCGGREIVAVHTTEPPPCMSQLHWFSALLRYPGDGKDISNFCLMPQFFQLSRSSDDKSSCNGLFFRLGRMFHGYSGHMHNTHQRYCWA